MPAQPFSVHVDPDDLARRDLSAAVSLPATVTGVPDQQPTAVTRHGRRDARAAARQRSDRDRTARAAGGSARTYAFRRS